MFLADTQIAIFDGTEVPIRGMRPGVMLMARPGYKCNVLSVSMKHYDGDIINVFYQDDGVIRATPEQIIETDRGDLAAYLICPGDRLHTPLIGSTGMVYWDVESTRRIPFAGNVYSLLVDGGGSYVAGGVLVHQGP